MAPGGLATVDNRFARADRTYRSHIFGVKANVKDGLHYLDDTVVVYAAGHHVVKYNVETSVQEFVNGSEMSKGITALTISPSKT